MNFTEQKDLYPNTYRLIKEYSLDGYRSIRKLPPTDTFEVVGIFLSETFLSYPSDTFLDILQNEHISMLLQYFFTREEMDLTFKRDLFILVSQEFEIIFDELFDEATEENKYTILQEFYTFVDEEEHRHLRINNH